MLPININMITQSSHINIYFGLILLKFPRVVEIQNTFIRSI